MVKRGREENCVTILFNKNKNLLAQSLVLVTGTKVNTCPKLLCRRAPAVELNPRGVPVVSPMPLPLCHHATVYWFFFSRGTGFCYIKICPHFVV